MFIKKYRELIKSISHHINPESIPVFVEYLDTHILEVFDCIKLLAEYELKEEEISTLTGFPTRGQARTAAAYG